MCKGGGRRRGKKEKNSIVTCYREKQREGERERERDRGRRVKRKTNEKIIKDLRAGLCIGRESDEGRKDLEEKEERRQKMQRGSSSWRLLATSIQSFRRRCSALGKLY